MSVSGVSGGSCMAGMYTNSGVRSVAVAATTASVISQQPSLDPKLGNRVDISV